MIKLMLKILSIKQKQTNQSLNYYRKKLESCCLIKGNMSFIFRSLEEGTTEISESNRNILSESISNDCLVTLSWTLNLRCFKIQRKLSERISEERLIKFKILRQRLESKGLIFDKYPEEYETKAYQNEYNKRQFLSRISYKQFIDLEHRMRALKFNFDKGMTLNE